MKTLYMQIKRIIRVSLQGIVFSKKKAEYIPAEPRLTNCSFEEKKVVYRAKPINRYYHPCDGTLESEDKEKAG